MIQDRCQYQTQVKRLYLYFCMKKKKTKKTMASNLAMASSQEEEEGTLMFFYGSLPVALHVAQVPWAGLTLTPEHGLINLRQNTQRRVCDALAVRKVRKVAGGREGLGRVWENTIRSKLLIFLKMRLGSIRNKSLQCGT